MKLLLVDDHTLFRDALVQYLERAEPCISITLAKNFFEASDILKNNTAFDLVLLDLRMPGMNGLEGLSTIRNDYPELRVALMSGVAEPDDVTGAMELGAAGYFPKTLSGKALLQAIQLVLAGQRFMPLGEDNKIMPSYYPDEPLMNGDGKAQAKDDRTGMPKTTNDIKLTTREREILHFLTKGAANKEIARELDLQVVTVKLHVRSVCRKLNAKNRTQAAMQAKELGLLANAD